MKQKSPIHKRSPVGSSVITALKRYFSGRPDILFAFLFGSQSKKLASKISDWDIAVYFKPDGSSNVEWEEAVGEYPSENEVWDDLVDILKTDEVDLVVLNRASSNIASSAVNGMPLVMRDRRLFLTFTLRAAREAEDYREFVNDYYAISQRSQSLSGQDAEQLKKTISFLEDEMSSWEYFLSFTFPDYQDSHKRRDIERWVENLLNSSIDIGKIILASEKKRMPDFYRDVFVQLGAIPKFKSIEVSKFTAWVKLRNILAHEYLDIRWQKIEAFVKTSQPHFRKFTVCAKDFLE